MKKFVSCLIGTALCFSPITALADCPDSLNKCDVALHAEIDLNTSLTQKSALDDQLISVLNTKVSQEEIWKPIAIGAGVVVVLETIIIILRK